MQNDNDHEPSIPMAPMEFSIDTLEGNSMLPEHGYMSTDMDMMHSGSTYDFDAMSQLHSISDHSRAQFSPSPHFFDAINPVTNGVVGMLPAAMVARGNVFSVHKNLVPMLHPHTLQSSVPHLHQDMHGRHYNLQHDLCYDETTGLSHDASTIPPPHHSGPTIEGSDSQSESDDAHKCELGFFPSQTDEANEMSTLTTATGEVVPVKSMTCRIIKGIRSIKNHGHVCHKKNHFQVEVEAEFAHDNIACVLPHGSSIHNLQKITGFLLDMHGAKQEELSSVVQITQSTVHRTRDSFKPIEVHINGNKIVQPIARLHFATTTANNMRKKGRPNPDQKFFVLVVSLYALAGGEKYLVAQIQSGKLIVRASNPVPTDGQYPQAWTTGKTPRTVYHQGAVGINFVGPEEALVVGGNTRVTGNMYQPSDRRVKENIQPAHISGKLQDLSTVPLYKYDFTGAWSSKVNLDEFSKSAVGPMAQELQAAAPHLVKTTNIEVPLEDGTTDDGLLMVKKDQLAMEVIGAAQAMAQSIEKLEEKVAEAQEEFSQLVQEAEGVQKPYVSEMGVEELGTLSTIMHSLGFR